MIGGNNLDINQMRYFIEICSCGSMSKASEKLHLSPQGLSLAIRRMEDELGCDLFYRKSSGLILTEIGQQFKTEAEAALRHVDNIYSLCSKGLKKEIHIKGCDVYSCPAQASRLHHRLPSLFPLHSRPLLQAADSSSMPERFPPEMPL